jgi:methionyl-tRNA synthetase
MSPKKFYLTTAIPYVNAKPHLGHALEFVQADAIARYHRLLGEDVLLLSGSDENALKNVQAAETQHQDVQAFIDQNTQTFETLSRALLVQFDVFQRGSDQKHHFPSSQELWRRCMDNGDIYKKSYRGLYCIGCETFYDPKDLNKEGECFEHPGKKLEVIEEENYFFKLSAYQSDIVRRLSTDEILILPKFRKNEVMAFLERGLEDISISRSNERAKNWGVPVPGDDTQRMYVWFDALNIYQSGIGFGWNQEKYQKYWPADVHVIGKGISRFHAVYWPAFLLSAKLQLPKTIFVHGYFTVNGQKMSKTLGNVIDPIALVEKYGPESLRYYFLREIPAYMDGDFSQSRFVELYNGDLANGLGNLVARTAKLAQGLEFETKPLTFSQALTPSYQDAMQEFRFSDAIKTIQDIIKTQDTYINQTEPWKLQGDKRQTTLSPVVEALRQIALLLQPFLPTTGKMIEAQFGSSHIAAQAALFPRIVT